MLFTHRNNQFFCCETLLKSLYFSGFSKYGKLYSPHRYDGGPYHAWEGASSVVWTDITSGPDLVLVTNP